MIFSVNSGYSDCMISDNELENCGKKYAWPLTKHYSRICLGDLKKTIKNLGQNN
jgi:hypothetical protein